MLASRIAWLRRSRMEHQIRHLLADPVAGPLSEAVANLDSDSLPIVDPTQSPDLGPAARWANGRLRKR